MEIARASTSPKMKEKQIVKAAGETTGKVYEGPNSPVSVEIALLKLARHWAVPCISNLAKMRVEAAPSQ